MSIALIVSGSGPNHAACSCQSPPFTSQLFGMFSASSPLMCCRGLVFRTLTGSVVLAGRPVGAVFSLVDILCLIVLLFRPFRQPCSSIGVVPNMAYTRCSRLPRHPLAAAQAALAAPFRTALSASRQC